MPLAELSAQKVFCSILQKKKKKRNSILGTLDRKEHWLITVKGPLSSNLEPVVQKIAMISQGVQYTNFTVSRPIPVII